MSSTLTSKSAPIVIIGAGVFGLSTALHLAERGYTNVKVLDKKPYHEKRYVYDKGCDAASADINKIIRAAYGSQQEYQDLAVDAISHWKKWNEEIAQGKSLPPGFTQEDVLFVNNGNLTMTSNDSMPDFERATIENMKKAGLEKTQCVLTHPRDVERAGAEGFAFAVNPFNRKNNYALLDIQGGFLYADKACHFALHKAEELGVQFVLSSTKGAFSSFLSDANSGIKGVKTADGESHSAELTIMACGGWTPSLVPQLDNLCETTAGSVAVFQLPDDPALWDRFSPKKFPTWTYDIRDGKSGGLYGFSRDEKGAVKIGYRGTKFTNPQAQADGNVRSIPITRWTDQATRQLPLVAARVIKNFVEEFLPELVSCEVKTRLCWYTDSVDNHFVIDFVPGTSGLMVATGGSGHGFKFLPNLGGHVVDKIEGKSNNYLGFWKWRSLGAGQKPYNKIMEGVASERSLQNQGLTMDDSLSQQDSHL